MFWRNHPEYRHLSKLLPKIISSLVFRLKPVVIGRGGSQKPAAHFHFKHVQILINLNVFNRFKIGQKIWFDHFPGKIYQIPMNYPENSGLLTDFHSLCSQRGGGRFAYENLPQIDLRLAPKIIKILKFSYFAIDDLLS